MNNENTFGVHYVLRNSKRIVGYSPLRGWVGELFEFFAFLQMTANSFQHFCRIYIDRRVNDIQFISP